MSEIYVFAERVMAAPPERVYRCIADYREHHARFLPPAFSDLVVEQGGVGAGTIIRFNMKVGGRVRAGRMRVEEPEPGRVLTESDPGSSLVTTFTVDPYEGGSRVRIEPRWLGSGGVGGWFERVFAPRLLRPIFVDELERLDVYARQLEALALGGV